MQDILGELYKVDDKMLQHLDWLEDHPQTYKRVPTQCIMIQTDPSSEFTNQSIVNCEVYMIFDFKPYLLSLPFLSCYEDSTDESLKYKSREDKDETGQTLRSEIKNDTTV